MSQKGALAIGQDTTGSDLTSACLEYLKEMTSRLDDQTTQELVSAIKKASLDTELNLSEKDWTRLADAALTIGSEALDRLTRRITILSRIQWVRFLSGSSILPERILLDAQ